MKKVKIIFFLASAFFAFITFVNLMLCSDSPLPFVQESYIGSTKVYEVSFDHPWGSALAFGVAKEIDKSFAWELALAMYKSGLHKMVFINLLLTLLCLISGLYVSKFDIIKKQRNKKVILTDN